MLVNKRINELSKFTSKELSRTALQGVCITNNEAVATDGHVLAIMPIDAGMPDADYPAGPELDVDIPQPLLISTEQIKNAVAVLPKKPTLPILNNIQIGVKDGAPVINAGLPVVQMPGSESEGMDYPNYKQVIPDYSNTHSVKLALNGKLLKLLCELAAKHGNIGTYQITFEIPAESEHVNQGVKWEVKNDDEVMFHGVIMPLRITE